MKPLAALVAILAGALLAVSLAFAEDATPTPTPPLTPTPTPTPTPLVTPIPIPTPPPLPDPLPPGCAPDAAESPLAPAAPTDLWLELTANPNLPDLPAMVVVLRWTDNSENETCFAIERKLGADDWEWLSAVGANQVGTYAYGFVSEAEHCYRVYAGNEAGRSDYSNEACIQLAAPAPPPTPAQVTATPVATPPLATPVPPPMEPVLHCGPEPRPTPLPDLLPPSDLDAQLVPLREYDFGVRLTWQDNSLDETCFGLQRKGGESKDWVAVQFLLADTTEATDEVFYAPGLYCYRVYAGKAEGTSAPSNETCIEMPMATVPTPPATPVASPPIPSPSPLVTPSAAVGQLAAPVRALPATGGVGVLASSEASCVAWCALIAAAVSLSAIAVLAFARATRR